MMLIQLIKMEEITYTLHVTTIELMKGDVSLGHSPVIHIKGKNPRMYTDGDEPVTFDTPKEARQYGIDKLEEITQTSDEG